MAHTFKSIALTALLVFSVLAATTPMAAAQNTPAPASNSNLKLVITADPTPIKPLSGVATVKVTGTYTYSTHGIGLVPTTVRMEIADKPSWSTITLAPRTIPVPVADGTPGAGTTRSSNFETTLTIFTLADAPAFTPGDVKLTATADPNGDIASSTVTEGFSITADFFSIIDAQLPSTIQIARPQQQIGYPITVKNFGNADTKIFFDVVSAPADFQVIPPTPTILESKQRGGKQTQADVVLTIQTPHKNGYMNSVGAVTVKIRSNYALDSKALGDQTQFTVVTTTKGFYVPGPDAAFFVIALGLVAVALGGRRRRSG